MSLEKLMKQLKTENGVTLVELLAAIAILSIIVTAFLALFTQAGRTNSMIDDKNEATFIAVEEMEKITNLSQQGKSFGELEEVYLKEYAGYSLTVPTINSDTEISVETTKDGFKVTLHVKYEVVKEAKNDKEPTMLHHAIVTVKGGRENATMQSYLHFKK